MHPFKNDVNKAIELRQPKIGTIALLFVFCLLLLDVRVGAIEINKSVKRDLGMVNKGNNINVIK